MSTDSATNGKPDYRDLTPEEWYAGYFNGIDDLDANFGRTEARPDASRKWKNVEYLRLRDHGLHLLAPSPGMRILDIGCASGATMVYCGLQGATVQGVDLDAGAVELTNHELKRFGINGGAVVGDATRLAFDDNSFDAVVSNDFVEHIDDATKIAMFREVRRVLKPGRPVITKTPNLAYAHLSVNFKRLRALASLKSPRGFVIPHTPGTAIPEHIGLTTRWAFTRCLVAAGFLNYEYHYAPLRRFGLSLAMDVLSTEVPVVRDLLCEDLLCRAYKPICGSHFPD
jgi:2-polyprenyl-3-methyl-5-hydroxy-6-metoxy-1,4-benzoquinol methylase